MRADGFFAAIVLCDLGFAAAGLTSNSLDWRAPISYAKHHPPFVVHPIGACAGKPRRLRLRGEAFLYPWWNVLISIGDNPCAWFHSRGRARWETH